MLSRPITAIKVLNMNVSEKLNVGEVIRDLLEFSMQLINIFNVSQLAMHDFDRRNWYSIGFSFEKLFIDFAFCITSVSGLKAKRFDKNWEIKAELDIRTQFAVNTFQK